MNSDSPGGYAPDGPADLMHHWLRSQLLMLGVPEADYGAVGLHVGSTVCWVRLTPSYRSSSDGIMFWYSPGAEEWIVPLRAACPLTSADRLVNARTPTSKIVEVIANYWFSNQKGAP